MALEDQDVSSNQGAPAAVPPPSGSAPGVSVPPLPIQEANKPTGTGDDEGLPGVPEIVPGEVMRQWLGRALQPPPGARPAAPGSFADKLGSVINQFDRGFGDVASATKDLVPGESGKVAGLANVARARTERLKGERQEARTEQEFQQRSAMNAVEMLSHINAIQKENLQTQNLIFDSNKAASKAREDAGWDVNHGITELEARRLVKEYGIDKDGRHYTDLHEFIPVGMTEINGKRMPIYDDVTKSSRNVPVTEDEAKFIKDNGGPDLLIKDKDGVFQPSQVANTSLTSMRLQAQRVATARQQLEDSMKRKLTSDQFNAVQTALSTKAVQDALATDPADRVNALQQSLEYLAGDGTPQNPGQVAKEQAMLQAAQKTGDQRAIQEAQSWLEAHKGDLDSIRTVLSYGITPEDRKESEKFQRDRETERRDRERERLKQLEIDKKAAAAKTASGEETDPEAEGLMGQDYLNFLQRKRPDDWGTIKSIGEGRAQMPSRISKEGLKLRNMINRAYGEWDESLGKDWPGVRKEYMSNGKAAVQATSYNALFRHMAALYDHTTPKGMVPYTDDYNARQADIAHVKEELAKSVSAGVMTESDKKDFEDHLLGTFTRPSDKRLRIQEAAQLAHDRMEEMQKKFESNKPSPEIKVPTLISDTGRIGLDYVVSGGKSKAPSAYKAGDDAPGQDASKAGVPSPASGQQQPAQGGAAAPPAKAPAGAIQKPARIPKDYNAFQQVNGNWYWINTQTKKGIPATPEEVKAAGAQ